MRLLLQKNSSLIWKFANKQLFSLEMRLSSKLCKNKAFRAQVMLIHSILHWPECTELEPRPYAFINALYFWNHMP